MNYGISGLSIIPVRREPSEKSEMITQILFGEHFTVYEIMMGWCRVKLAYDGYEGWVDQKMVTPLTDRAFYKIEHAPFAVCTDIFNLVQVDCEQPLMIVAGSTLPCWRAYKKEFGIPSGWYSLNGNVMYKKPKNIRKFMIEQALKYFNAPYLWGGRSPFGIDCSGFSQIIYKMAGYSIPRDASRQVHCGVAFSFIEEAQPGDLAFFDNDEGTIVHVGIIWEKNKIIHASGKVRIDNIDHYGIFNVETSRYTHKLRVMKRIVEY